MRSGFEVRCIGPLLGAASWLLFALPLRPAAGGPTDAVGQVNAARYEVKAQGAEPGQWFFYRTRDEIVLQGPSHEDRWRRNSKGQVSLERIFPAEGRSVFYAPGELLARGVSADWGALWYLWDPRSVSPSARVPDGNEGWRWQSADLSVHWSNRLDLPLEIIRRAPGPQNSRVHWRLLAHAGQRPADWPAPASPVLDRIDAADLGDRPVDAFVHRVEQLEIQSGWHASSHPEGPP